MAEQERLPIVVGVDGHETGRRALEWALREAQTRNCRVLLVHAWTFGPMAESLTQTSGRQVHQESLAMLTREVERATDTMTDVPPISEYSLEGDPIRILPTLSRRAAMLVVGRHQDGLVRQAVLGSVSAACVHHALCPVVVIPATVAAHEATSSAEPAVAARD